MPPVSENETRKCPLCGRLRKAQQNPFKAGSWWFPPRCDCEVEEFNRKEAARLAQEEQDRLDRIFGLFEVPNRFQERRLENFRPDTGSQDAFETVRRFIESLDQHVAEGAGVWLEGDNGNGKTHLAASVYHVAKERRLTSVFVVVPDFLDQIKQTFDRKKKKASDLEDWQLINPIKTAKVVILDDIGVANASDWDRKTLFTIVNYRYEHKLTTIITTNKNADELVEIIGKATVDRLLGMCAFAENLGESRRLGEAPTV